MNEWVQQESLNQQRHSLLGYIHPTVPSLHHQTQRDGDPLKLSETSLIPLQTCNTSTDISLPTCLISVSPVVFKCLSK